MASFSFRKTIVLGFVVALAIICFFAIYTYINMQRGEKVNRELESLLTTLRLTESLYDNIQEIEFGQRGYIISGNKAHLQPYYDGLRNIASDTQIIKTLPSVDLDRDVELRSLLDLINQKIAFTSLTIKLKDESGFVAAQEKIKTGEGKELKDKIHDLIRHIEGEDRVVLDTFSANRAHRARLTTWLITALAGLFVLFLALFFWLFRTDVRKRMGAEITARVEANTVAFKDILDRISDGFMALDRDWKFVYINSSYESSAGRFDLLGKNIWEEFPDTVGNEFFQAYHKALETQEYVYLEAYYPGFDAWFENHIYPSAYGLSVHSRNITDKKKMETRLQHAVDRFNMVASATSDILWEADLRKKNIWWNDNFYEKFGYDKKGDFSAGDSWEKLLHPSDRDRVVEKINSILYKSDEISWIDEYRFRRADGTYADIYDRCYIMRDARGHPYKVIGSMTDISMLIQTREKLSNTEDRYRIIVEEASDAIFINDLKGNFNDVNDRACKMFGYSPEELRKMNMPQLLQGQNGSRHIFEDLLSGELPSLECFMIHRNGTEIPVDITARKLSDGRTIAIVRDITERKKAEEQLAKNEEQLKLIYNACRDIIFLIAIEPNRCFRFRSVNEAFLQITGLSEGKVIGKCIEKVIPEGSVEMVKGYYEEAISRKQTLQWEETSVFPNGEKTGILSVTPVFNSDGECNLLVGSIHDITDRKRNEEELRKSKEDFTSLVDSVDGIVWEADAETFQFTFVSQQAERLLGYPVHMWMDEINFWADHIHPQDREWAVNFCLKNSQLAKSYEFEYRMIAADGRIVWLKDIVSVIKEDNKIKRLQGIIIDITEKKKSDEIIGEIEERRRLIMNAALDAIVSVDQDGAIIFWNPQAEKIFGWKEEEMKGRLLVDTIVPERYKERHLRGFSHYLRTGEATVFNRLLELSGMHKDGREFQIEMSILPIVQEGVTTFTAFIRDITESKKAAEQLKLSVERFETIATATHDAIWEWNFETGELWANEVHQEMYGLTKKDPVPKVDEWMSRLHPDDLDKVYSAQEMALRSDINYWESEYRFRRKDGSYINLFDRCYIIRDRFHKPIRLTGSMIDITNRKKAELDLRESEERYRSVIEQASDFIMITDQTGNFIDVNSNFLKTFGYNKDEFLELNVKDVIDPKQLEEKPVRFDLLMMGQSVLNERRMINRQGNIIDVEANVKMLPDGRVLAIARDIRDRKKAEAEIRKARELADKLIDALPGVFYFFDEQGRILRWNKEFELATGYPAEEIADMGPSDFFPDEEKEYINERINSVFEKGIGDAEGNFLTKSGEKTSYYFRAVLLNYDGRPCLLGCGIDISERKKAEEALRSSEKKYKLLFENNPMPMWMINLPELNIIDVNDAAIKHYGYSRDEFLSLNTTQIRPEEDVPNYLQSAKNPQGGVRYAGIWRHKKKDGTVIDVEIIAHDIDYGDQPARLILSNDITEKLNADRLVKKSFEDIRSLTEHIQTIREEERAHIAREIHDELGQQLTVLKMDVSWLNKKIQSDAAVKDKLNELTEMLDGTVRTVRRISSELRPSLLDDLGLIAAIDWHLKEFEKRTGILTEFKEPAAELTLPDNINTGLFRIIQESLTNVTRHANADKVQVSLLQNNGTLVLQIQDDGKGFDKEKEANKRTLGILGMKERTEMMGGKYEISSVVGKGTTVVVSIPNKGGLNKKSLIG